MVVKVKLRHLNITSGRKGSGRLYVYFRETGELLLKFDGTRAELDRRLEEPDMLGAYNSRRKRDLKQIYPEGTLGSLVHWFENECPRYEKLADATKKDYQAAFPYLRPEFDTHLITITQPALYGVRDRCAKEKWPRFADKMMAALSSMFTQAVKRGNRSRIRLSVSTRRIRPIPIPTASGRRQSGRMLSRSLRGRSQFR